MQTLHATQESRLKFDGMVTRSDLMLPVFDETTRAAEVDVSVLITGESGTGKGLIAEFLQSYHWPGNIRQLRNCMESMFILADATTLTVDDLPETIRGDGRGETVRLQLPERLTLEEVQRAMVYRTLERHYGNRTHAAHSLGISVRTLQRWLHRWEQGGQE
jgi:transcriptional regulator with PAS, ATPase and Fis domain